MASFRRMPGLPPYGPMAIGFPEDWGKLGREGIVVEFTADDGSTWTGNFDGGLGGVDDVRWHPNRRHVLVTVNGLMWCVDPNTRFATEIASAIFRVWDIPGSDDLLLNDQGLALIRIGCHGVVWETRRASWDGFGDCRFEGDRFVGEAWSPFEDCCLPFALDLSTGQVIGGSYNGPSTSKRPLPIIRGGRLNRNGSGR